MLPGGEGVVKVAKWVVVVVVVLVLFSSGGWFAFLAVLAVGVLAVLARPSRRWFKRWWLTRQGWSSEDAAAVVRVREAWPVAAEQAGLVVRRSDGTKEIAYVAQVSAVPTGVRVVVAMPGGVKPANLDVDRLASALALRLAATAEVVTPVHAAVTVVLHDPAGGVRSVDLTQQPRWEIGDPWGEQR